MEETIKMYIPFSGFYGSVWTGAIDNEIEYLLEQYDQEVDHYDDATDYRNLFRVLAEVYMGMLLEEAFEETGCSSLLTVSFVGVNSPREYNFQTDLLEVEIPKSQIPQLLDMTDWKILAAMIKEECSDRSGFISFVSPDIEDWFEIKPESWRPSQWELVIRALFETYGFDWEEAEERISESYQARELISELVDINVAFV